MLTDHGLRTSLLQDLKMETNGARRLSRSAELLSFWKDPRAGKTRVVLAFRVAGGLGTGCGLLRGTPNSTATSLRQRQR